MTPIRRHPSWAKWGFVQKASWLVETHQARDYSQACSLLAAQRKAKAAPSKPVVARLPYAD